MRRAGAAALAAVALLAAAGCGAGESGTSDRLVVSAAASLSEPLGACSRRFERASVRLSFAGSDELAAQIRQGVRPDVFAAANTKLPEALAAEGLVGRPVVFATNELVIAVPRSSHITSVDDLAARGTTVAIGAASVPVGAYTRAVLARLDGATAKGILANVRTAEPDVKGVVGKVAQGAADAGFVYATDVDAAPERLRAIALPADAEPTVAYGAAVVEGAPNPAAAQRYLDGLVHGGCAQALRQAGFGAPGGAG